MIKKDVIRVVTSFTIIFAWDALCEYVDGKRIENKVDALYWAGAEKVGYMQTKMPFTYTIWWQGVEDVNNTKDVTKLVKIYKKVKKANKGKEMPKYEGLDAYDFKTKTIFGQRISFKKKSLKEVTE